MGCGGYLDTFPSVPYPIGAGLGLVGVVGGLVTLALALNFKGSAGVGRGAVGSGFLMTCA